MPIHGCLYIFVLCMLFSNGNTAGSEKEPVLKLNVRDESHSMEAYVMDNVNMPYSTSYNFKIDCKNPAYVDESKISLPSMHYPEGKSRGTYVELGILACSQILSEEYINTWITFNTDKDTKKFEKRTGAVSFVSVTDNLKYEETRDCCDSGKTCPTPGKCFDRPTTTCSFMIIHPVDNLLLRKGQCHSLCQHVNCRLTCPDGTVNLNFKELCLFL
jgi:hypothetical protein